VSALANFGLCDVRGSPCRDFVVLGEDIVRHEDLNCLFEVYRVSTSIMVMAVERTI
jgi:hypothetical protein